MSPIKKCGCGREFTRKTFDNLPQLPNWEWEWGEVQEVRNCQCGSTIVVVIKEGTPEDEDAYKRA